MSSKLIRAIHRCALACFFFSLMVTAAVAAQSVNVGMTRHTWGLEDGLPDRVIQAIAQTPNGYLWLGTPSGLVRFDGFKFVTFGTEMAPTLHEFGGSCILVAKDGTLWVGSVGGGVTHLNPHSATHYGTGQGLRALTVRALYQSGDGTIWAGTDNGLYELVKGRFSLVKEIGDQNVTTIVSDGSGGFWVAGAHLTHYQHGRFVAIPLPPLKSVIRSLAVAPGGGLWIGALGRLMELKKDGSIRMIPNIHADVRALCFDHTGKLWIGTVGSGVLLKMLDGVIVSELDPKKPAYKGVRTIVCTRNGDIWIGTQAGLTRLSHTGMDFVKIPNSGTSDFGSVFLGHDGSVWLSAGSVSRYADGKAYTIDLPALKGAQVRCVYRDSSGAFWVGTDGNGVYRLVHGRVAAHLLRSIAITGFLGTPNGAVWIGTDGGLANWSQGKLTTFSFSGDMMMGTVRAMALTGDGSIWVVTPAGLFLFRKGHYLRPEVAHRLAGFRIWSLYVAKNGSLWIGTGTGLYLWRHGDLMRIDLPQSTFQSQAIISVLADAKGRFLIAKPTIICRITRNDLDRSIAASKRVGADGIQEVHLIDAPEIFAVGSETGTELYSEIPGVASANHRGGAWYATYQGLLHIAASRPSRVRQPPPVVIEKVLVDGVPVSGSGPIVLSPSTHSVQFRATPILLSGSAGLRLRQRLFGLNKKWSELAPGSLSSYGKLAPGRYTFQVEAYWPGTKAVSTAKVTVIQQSAIYRRAWFIAMCCVLAAFVAWLFYRFRIHQMTLRFQAVANERGRVAREIHDTLLQGCIGALSLLEALEISHERSRANPRPSEENRWLAVVQCVCEQFEGTIKEAREAIWNLRNADDRRSLDETLRDTLKRLTSRAGVETSFQVEGEAVPIIPRVQHEIIMSTREAIINSVSHASPASIDVRLSFDSSCVIVSISDDGVGFDPKVVQLTDSGHCGLSGMCDRMRKFHGSMTIESEPGRGTKIRLSLPLNTCRIRVKR